MIKAAPMAGNAKTAQAFARQGLPIFPCGPDKRPLVRWKEAATADPETVANWWRQHPAALVGLPTGARSGVYAVDCDLDRDTGETVGESALAALGLGRLLTDPAQPRVRTASGGLHLLFAHPGEGFGNTAGKLGPKIDTRGEGGFIIAVGSTGPAGSYTAETPIDWGALPDLPDLLRRALSSHGPAEAPKLVAKTAGDLWAATALHKELAAVLAAPEGQRNATLNRAAFALGQIVAGGHLHEVTVRERLHAAAASIGLDGAETAATVDSGLRAGAASPRGPKGDREPAGRSGPRADRRRDTLPKIELPKGDTAAAVDATLEQLRRDPLAFDFGGQLALVEAGRAHPLCEHGLAHHLGRTHRYWRARQAEAGPIEDPADPPPALVRQVLALGERRKLKPLDAVVTGPTLRLDGSVLSTPGYDAATRLLFDPLGEPVPHVPDRPNRAQARAALDTLLAPFTDFPFAGAAARGALLAALLTATVRPVLPTAPAFAFDAPAPGAGKTLLAQCVGALVEGRAPDLWPHTAGRDDEEVRKRLFTALRTGARALVWDNVTGTFDSASMAATITAEAVVDRVLGRSESIRIPNRALLIMTGNNLTLAGDLPRRVIACRIDPETDRPFARRFDLDPLAYVLAHRLEMLAAACILMRASLAQPIPRADGKLASFEAWDDLVRQTVVWTDSVLAPRTFGDPMELIAEAQAADPEGEALHNVLLSLRARFRAAEFSARDVLEAIRDTQSNDELANALRDMAGDNALRSVRSLGRALKFREGRIVHGLRLIGRRDPHAGALLYKVSEA